MWIDSWKVAAADVDAAYLMDLSGRYSVGAVAHASRDPASSPIDRWKRSPVTSRFARAGGSRRSLGIQSKLLIVLLVVSVLSVLVAGAVGYVSGTDSLRNAEFDRMTQLRESRAREITSYYRTVTDAASIVTHGTTTVNAVREFSAAFAELESAPPSPDAKAAVAKYYETVFAPALSERTGEPADPTLFEPTGNAAVALRSLPR